MSHFKPSEFHIQQEKDLLKIDRVIKTDTPFERKVADFQFDTLADPSRGNYEQNRQLYGSLAATDHHTLRAQKDQRFSINPLLRDPLSIEQEERRVIEDKVQAQVQVMAVKVHEEATKTGYAAGLEKGYAEAYQRFKEEAAERLAGLESFLNSAETAKQEILEANQTFILKSILCIAHRLALKEISTDKDYIVKLAKELISRTGARDQIRVRIHPDEAQSLEMLKEGLEQQMTGLTNLSVETSLDVGRGGVVVETDFTRLDGSLEVQYKKISEALLSEPPASAPAATGTGA